MAHRCIHGTRGPGATNQWVPAPLVHERVVVRRTPTPPRIPHLLLFLLPAACMSSEKAVAEKQQIFGNRKCAFLMLSKELLDIYKQQVVPPGCCLVPAPCLVAARRPQSRSMPSPAPHALDTRPYLALRGLRRPLHRSLLPPHAPPAPLPQSLEMFVDSEGDDVFQWGVELSSFAPDSGLAQVRGCCGVAGGGCNRTTNDPFFG